MNDTVMAKPRLNIKCGVYAYEIDSKLRTSSRIYVYWDTIPVAMTMILEYDVKFM